MVPGQRTNGRGRGNALGDVPELGERRGQRRAASQRKSDAPVARQIARARQHEIAEAGQSHHRFAAAAHRSAEATHLRNAAGDERCAGVVAESQAVAGACRDREQVAGILLGLACALKPQIGATFMAYFLLTRRWATFRFAAIVSLAILATTGHVLYHHRSRSELRRPALLLLALLATQVTLGALTVLSKKEFIINSLHVVTGASVLVTSLALTLRAHRARFATDGRRADASASADTRIGRLAGDHA